MSALQQNNKDLLVVTHEELDLFRQFIETVEMQIVEATNYDYAAAEIIWNNFDVLQFMRKKGSGFNEFLDCFHRNEQTEGLSPVIRGYLELITVEHVWSELTCPGFIAEGKGDYSYSADGTIESSSLSPFQTEVFSQFDPAVDYGDTNTIIPSIWTTSNGESVDYRTYFANELALSQAFQILEKGPYWNSMSSDSSENRQAEFEHVFNSLFPNAEGKFTFSLEHAGAVYVNGKWFYPSSTMWNSEMENANDLYVTLAELLDKPRDFGTENGQDIKINIDHINELLKYVKRDESDFLEGTYTLVSRVEYDGIHAPYLGGVLTMTDASGNPVQFNTLKDFVAYIKMVNGKDPRGYGHAVSINDVEIEQHHDEQTTSDSINTHVMELTAAEMSGSLTDLINEYQTDHPNEYPFQMAITLSTSEFNTIEESGVPYSRACYDKNGDFVIFHFNVVNGKIDVVDETDPIIAYDAEGNGYEYHMLPQEIKDYIKDYLAFEV